MFVRVVRFSDVTPERIDGLVNQINESGAPPPGVSISRLQLYVDSDQGTAIVCQYFETAEQMADSARVFAAMDPSETPGTRVSVDTCEVRLDLLTSP